MSRTGKVFVKISHFQLIDVSFSLIQHILSGQLYTETINLCQLDVYVC